MPTSAQLIDRYPGVVDLAIKNRPAAASYVVAAALTLDAAYAGATAMVTVPKGTTYRSPRLQRNRKNLVEETFRGLTRVSYDPTDFAAAAVPGDNAISFVRVAEIDYGGTTHSQGPILVVPPSGYLKSGKSTIFLSGTGPNVASPGSGLPPATAMWVELPRFVSDITVYNDEAGGGTSLFWSPGIGFPEIEIPAGTSVQLKELGTNEILLRGDGGTAAFRLHAVLVNGVQA